MLCVRDIMTRDVVTLAPEATIREAMETLSTNHLSGAPVVAGESVVGVISMTDILAFIVSAADSPVETQVESIGESLEGSDAELDNEDIESDAMSRDLWADWNEASDSRVDDALPQGDKLLDQRTVEEAMNREVFSVTPAASVRQAATMMRERGIHRVLVMNRRSLVGIISSLDIARAVSERGVAGIRILPPCDGPSTWITT